MQNRADCRVVWLHERREGLMDVSEVGPLIVCVYIDLVAVG